MRPRRTTLARRCGLSARTLGTPVPRRNGDAFRPVAPESEAARVDARAGGGRVGDGCRARVGLLERQRLHRGVQADVRNDTGRYSVDETESAISRRVACAPALPRAASVDWRGLARVPVSVAESAASAIACFRRAISCKSSTSTGVQFAFFSSEYAMRRSAGALKYSSRLSGRPAFGRFSNSPLFRASRIRCSAVRLNGIRHFRRFRRCLTREQLQARIRRPILARCCEPFRATGV